MPPSIPAHWSGWSRMHEKARDYGVVVVGDPDQDPEGLTLDLAATERLRAKDAD
jgi:N-methylhydantoinase B